MDAVYHKGELTIQKKYGEDKVANRVKRSISNSIISGAFVFIENQSMVIVSSEDESGDVWISILFGKSGLTKVIDEDTISFNKELIYNSHEDIFFKNSTAKKEIGAIFIELGSRKRYRINGNVVENEKENITINVKEAYGNCPKYIQCRLFTFSNEIANRETVVFTGNKLNEEQQEWISNADTFFVGSKGEKGKLDASHRGGNPGFVELLHDGSLKIPDYVGNSMYNTLGNILENSNAGLLFINFKNGNTLQLNGSATLLFDQHTITDKERTSGTGRYWVFKVELIPRHFRFWIVIMPMSI